MKKISNTGRRREIVASRQDLNMIDRHVRAVVLRTSKSSEVIINSNPIKLSRHASPKETEIKTSGRGMVHITREQIIGLILGVLIPEEE